MKPLSTMALMLAVAASPAYALTVTNLDSVPHKVALSARGSADVRLIQPNATEYFTGASQGMLSLADEAAAPAKEPVKKKRGKGKKEAVKKDSVVHADGLLSGIIGNERTSGIPADPDSSYTIWPGGKLNVQARRKNAGRMF